MTRPLEFRLAIAALIAAGAAAQTPAPGSAAPRVDFAREIRPLLSDRCFVCHGPDERRRKAGLRLDVEAAAKAEVIVPGDPERSELYRRVSSPDPEERMPPRASHLSLSADEIERIRRWIEQGAGWTAHWSFEPPRAAPLPVVADAMWPRGGIDHFVRARLEREGLMPRPEADRETLIRRVTFDLTGLPPTLEEIDAFLADDAPGAYERIVDRLLASPRYGERMAAEWLDVARYSDTFGYQVDRDRRVWPWRDWVVRAFNANMPFDEFATRQIAGDLLPDADDDSILATAFQRLHGQKVEGGSVPEEFRTEYVADRTTTFGTAFLGLTLECARCHDHKYDPLSQREFYELFAFFNNIDEAGLYSFFTRSVPTPTLLLADSAKKRAIAALDARVAAAHKALRDAEGSCSDAFAAWLASRTGECATELPGQIAHLDFEGALRGPNRSVTSPFGRAIELTGDDAHGLKAGNFRRDQPFSVSLWLRTPDHKERAVVFHRSRAWTDAASRGYQLLIEDGELSASLIHFWPGNAIRVRTQARLVPGRWHHVAISYDGSSQAAGLRIWLDGALAASRVVRDNLYKNITGGGGDNIAIGARFRDRGFTGGQVDEFRVFDRELTAIEVAQLHDGTSLSDALAAGGPDALPDARRDDLLAFYVASADPEVAELRAALQAARAERNKLVDGVPEIMVMREMAEPRRTHVLERGAYDAPGAAVGADTPAVLPPLPAGLKRDRLGLARWLTAPDHPLTARVAVNRLWQMCFGTGLVRTPEDFGSQGEPPSHPQLLDWLAVRLGRGGWDLEAMLRDIVTSATYRQASTAPPDLVARDPENRLLARAPRHRLSAEMLRDNALAASGLLAAEIGGPPAKPPEVEVSFKPVKRQKGQYRRSLYTYWKRTAPAPVMVTLDASRRAVCRVRRERTASPLQALILLNGPEFVEAARVLAQRLIRQHGSDLDAVLRDAFRTLTSRFPSDAEQRVLRSLYDRQLAYFERAPQSAAAYLATGDAPCDPAIPAPRLAAAATVANTLMGYDDCVSRR